MKVRFTTAQGTVGVLEVPNPPASLDPRFDFLKTDEQLAAVENSRQTFAESFLREQMGVSFQIVAEFRLDADASNDDFSDLNLPDITRTTDFDAEV